MPRFKSRRRDPLQFVCWYNGGRNAVFHKTNKRHGMVIITGQNPVGHREHGTRWRIEIHVKVSQPIRAYTNIRVNWTDGTLVFTNPPQPLDAPLTGRAVGLDRGGVHQLATSDGMLLDLPKDRLARIDREIRRRQKAMARKAKTAGYPNPKDYLKAGASKRYEREREQVRKLHAKARRISMDWAQKTTTRLVRDYDLIAIEDLNLTGMTRKAKAKPDPDHPGHWLPNGQSRKHGLNRIMRTAALGTIARLLEYKTRLVPGKKLSAVNPAYTSQTCARCGHCAKDNRESQAVFHCKQCGHTANAGLNAAANILAKAVANGTEGDISIQSMDYALRTLNRIRHGDTTRENHAPAAREPQQPGEHPTVGIPCL